MRDDQPTVPLPPLYDGPDPQGLAGPGGGPRWLTDAPRSSRPSSQSKHPDLLGCCLGANGALLIGLLCVILLVRAGVIAPSGAASHPIPTVSTSATVSSTPSPTTTSTVANGLTVAPSSVRLGCDNGQQSQFVVLLNQGPETVQWQTQFSLPHGQAGVDLSPTQGQLRAGTSVSLHLNNNSHGTGQQGVISFAPTDSTAEAGTAASLSYTTMGCD